MVGDYVESKREIARDATVKDTQGVVEEKAEDEERGSAKGS